MSRSSRKWLTANMIRASWATISKVSPRFWGASSDIYEQATATLSFLIPLVSLPPIRAADY